MTLNSKQLAVIGSITDKQMNAINQVLLEDDTTVSHSDDMSSEDVDKILETLTPEQIAAVQQALSEPDPDEEGDQETDPKDEENPDDPKDKGNTEGKDANPTDTTGNEDPSMVNHNIFEGQSAKRDDVIQHSEEDLKAIFADAAANGSLHDAVVEHGINKMELLFPEATNVTPGGIQTIHDPLTATDQILGAVTKYPKGRIKVRFANLGATQAEVVEDLRAKGYIKGHFKKEQIFDLLGRETNTTTIYKKQGIDRDDLLDMEDFDIVSFYWKEMRMFLNEEIARAILVGDGRPKIGTDGNPNEDHIDDTKLKPITTDDDFYTLKETYTDMDDFIEKVIRIRKRMLGTGNRTLYTGVGFLDDLTLIKDTTGRYIYDEDSIRKQLRVAGIVETSLLPTNAALLGNLHDYTLSGNKGGQIFTADDFDIDYNKYKYLIETRLGGMVTSPLSFAYFTKAGTTPTTPAPSGTEG